MSELIVANVISKIPNEVSVIYNGISTDRQAVG